MPDRSLDSLSSDFLPLACEWVTRVLARGVPILILQTGRTPAEQAVNVANGTSRTSMSLHLPRAMRWHPELAILNPSEAGKSDAMDVAPYAQFVLHGSNKLQWDTSDSAWSIIGEEAERVGLRWGGRWHDPFDPGHAELVLPWKVKYLTEERARPWPTFKV